MIDELDRSVAGSKDRWILFNRQTSEGYPLVVLARTGNELVAAGLQVGIVTTIHCDASDWMINDRGMPQNSDRLYPVEEQLAAALEKLEIGALHVASVTGDGQRRIIFTHDRPLNFHTLLQGIEVQDYSFRVTEPTERSALLLLLVPTALDRQLDGDLSLISNIEKHGDDGQEPRKTDFWFYGGRAGLDGMVADLTPWGFSVEHWLSEPEGVVVTCNTPVNFGTFEELTPVLVATADKHQLTYDGWETFVVGSGGKAPSPRENARPVSLLSRLFGAKTN